MIVRNFDTNALFYAFVVGGVVWDTTRDRRVPPPSSPEPARAGRAPLRVTSRGRVRLIAPDDIDWIGAAGDYVELHVRGDVHLFETSLAALEHALPPDEFARIHRAALVRMDRVTEVRSLGRGDALVRLADGTDLRMSRRYRANLAGLLRPDGAGGPARRANRSRPPNGSGAEGVKPS